MHEKYIPEQVDPFRLAEQGLILEGLAPIAEMSRLIPSIQFKKNEQEDKESLAKVRFEFGVDEQGICFLLGHVETGLTLECQRCLEPFKYAIITDFALGVVSSLEDAKQLPEQYDPVLVQEGQLALRELIEDELILNLPIIPKHDPDTCRLTLPVRDSEWEQGKDENPFRVLELLKHKPQK